MNGGPILTRRQGRRWLFAGAEFDEDSWQLTVGNKRVPLEAKPSEVLHELLINSGAVVTKEQLLDAVWPDVHVVEGSITTAINKLRKALEADKAAHSVIETVPKIGYRLACPVECRNEKPQNTTPPSGEPPNRRRRWGRISVFVAATSIIAALPLGYRLVAALSRPAYTVADMTRAVTRIDQPKLEEILASGWDANRPMDDQGNSALNQLLAVCEWNPGHDRKAMLMFARTLLDAGADLTRRNYWGDTAYSIAVAPRYCGPDHPVTIMIRAQCFNGYHPANVTCLPDYEHSLAARNGGRLPGERAGER